jgi:hypothetical protein
MKPSSIVALLLLIAALALGIFAYQQSQTLTQTESALALAQADGSTQVAQAALDGTTAADTIAAAETQAAGELADVRGAAATLQAGSIATRSALGDLLTDFRATATQETSANATVVAIATATQVAAAALIDEQAAAFDELALAATADAQDLATQSASLAEVEGALEQSLTQIAIISAQATAQSIAAPTPRPSVVASGDAAPRNDVEVAALLLDDTFESTSSIPETEFPNSGRTQLLDGQLALILDDNPTEGLSALSQTTISDGYLEVEVYIDDCAPDSLLLIEIRANTTSTAGYAIGVDCGFTNWGIFRRTPTQAELLAVESFTTITPPTDEPYILGIEAQGSSLSLFVNGTRVGGIVDDTYADGIIGISLISDAAAQIRLDNLRVWELNATAALAPTPAPTIVSFNVFDAREALIALFPSVIETDAQDWQVSGDPQLGGDDINVSTVAWLMQGDGESQAVVAIIFGANTEELVQVTQGAGAELGITPLEDVPTDFPTPNAFGTSSDGLEAIWTQGNLIARVTLFGGEPTAERLLSLARAVRDLLPDAD